MILASDLLSIKYASSLEKIMETFDSFSGSACLVSYPVQLGTLTQTTIYLGGCPKLDFLFEMEFPKVY